MVYIGDGPSDVPCFSLVSRFGGRTYAVYKAGSDREYQNACDLRKQQRVEAFGEADYSDGSHTAKWITKAVEDIAEGIVRDRESIRGNELERPPGHAIKQVKMAYAGASFEPQHEAPDVLEASDSPAPKKSSGVARIAKAKGQNSDVARS
jgi:hypothetical protein